VTDATEHAAVFITGTRLADVPPTVVAAAKHSMLDGFGLAVAGSRTEAAQIARDEVGSYRCAATDAAALGTALRVPPRFAAFLNGLAIHADDYDDTQLATLPDRVYGLLTHPTAPVLPAALALGEAGGRTGADVLLAYVVGVEVETKVSEAINPRHYDDGFHSTGTVGTIGSGAAAASILGLTPDVTKIALSIAASQAAGLRENFGTMTKPFHAGRAAESGLLAASMAQRGFTAANNILESRRGFFSAAGGGYEPSAFTPGAPWTFDAPGVSIKPHPSGSLTHPAMFALMELLKKHDIQAADIEAVSVGTNRHMPNALIHQDPHDHLAAKFSMEFCMAILCIERRAGLAEFTDAVVMRPDVREMMRRVRFEVDPEAEGAGYNNMTSIVRIRLRNGTVYEGRAAFGKGSPQNPMSEAEVREKFMECVEAGGIGAEAGSRAADLILDIEHQGDVREVIRLLTSAPGSTP
jgi:2-methylcitrate dehydratase PrpD